MKLLLSRGECRAVRARRRDVQIFRHRVEALYATTVLVRLVILAVLLALYAYSRDPLFLSLFAIVGLGVVLTGTSYLLDRRRSSLASVL